MSEDRRSHFPNLLKNAGWWPERLVSCGRWGRRGGGAAGPALVHGGLALGSDPCAEGLGPLAKKSFGFHGLGSGLRGSQIWFSVPRSRFGPAWIRLVGPWAPVLETKFLVRLFEGGRSGPLGPCTVQAVVGSG